MQNLIYDISNKKFPFINSNLKNDQRLQFVMRKLDQNTKGGRRDSQSSFSAFGGNDKSPSHPTLQKSSSSSVMPGQTSGGGKLLGSLFGAK